MKLKDLKDTTFYCFRPLIQNCNTPQDGKALPPQNTRFIIFETVMHLKITSLHTPLCIVCHV